MVRIGGIQNVGILTQTAQPCFLVRKSTTQSNIPINTEVDVEFDTIVTDLGSNFNIGTYKFTAPVAGKYSFSSSIRFESRDTAAFYYQIRIITNNGDYDTLRMGDDFGSDSDASTNISIVSVDMDAGHTAHIAVYQSGGAVQTDIGTAATVTWFSGFLVA
jgi:hypothetical protein